MWWWKTILLLLVTESISVAAASIGRQSSAREGEGEEGEGKGEGGECQKFLQASPPCPLSEETLEELERSLEETMSRGVLYNAGRGQPSFGELLAWELLEEGRDSQAEEVGQEEGEEEEDYGLCRPGDLNSTVICDGRYMLSFPTDEIPDYPLDLLVVNATTLRSIRAGDLSGKSIVNLVLQENSLLSDLGRDAFRGLQNTTYLRTERNRLVVLAEEWDGDLFAPFRSLEALRYLLMESEDLNGGVLASYGDIRTAAPSLPCLEYLSLKGNPLTKIGSNLFSALRCSPLRELSLYSSGLQVIDKGSRNENCYLYFKMHP